MILGIDPGKHGAMVWLDKNLDAQFYPLFKYTESDIAFLVQSKMAVTDVAFLEKLGPNGQNGSIANFKLGDSYGFLRGQLVGRVKLEYIRPIAWQSALKCMGKTTTPHAEKKKITRAKAQEMFPEHCKKITHDTADALLIAEYGRRWFLKFGTTKFDLG